MWLLRALGLSASTISVELLRKRPLGTRRAGNVLEGCHYLLFTALARVNVEVFNSSKDTSWRAWAFSHSTCWELSR